MKIEYGYDKKVRSWNTIVFDDEGNEIESVYDGNTISRDFTIEFLKKEYHITEVVKIKAY